MKNHSTKITKNIRSLGTVLLVEEAIRRGIKVKHINKNQREMSFLELSYKNHYEYIKGQNISKTSFTAFYATENKAITKSFLSRSNIRTAKSKLIHRENIKELSEFIEKAGYPLVVKPFDGCQGKLVFVGVDTEEKCKKAIEEVFKKSKYALLEKEFKGEEYRIIASRNSFMAATNRVPANVIGDGISTIKELIEIKNDDPLRGGEDDSWKGKPLYKIKIDNILKDKLKKDCLKLGDVVSKDKQIFLRKNSNLSTGGDSVDVTDMVHPDLRKIAVKAVCAIPGLAYAGLDLMTNKDISKKPTKKSYIIVELNASPGIFMHHFPYKGKPRDVAKGIFDIFFPETI